MESELGPRIEGIHAGPVQFVKRGRPEGSAYESSKI